MIKFWQALVLMAVVGVAAWVISRATYTLPPVPPNIHHEDTAHAHIDSIVPTPKPPGSIPKPKYITVHDTTFVDTSACHHYVPDFDGVTVDSTVNGIRFRLDMLVPSWEHPTGLVESVDIWCPPSTVDTIFVPQIIREKDASMPWHWMVASGAAAGAAFTEQPWVGVAAVAAAGAYEALK
jgi:hypothetical protein